MYKYIDTKFDSKHIWHPYESLIKPTKSYPIIKASGAEIELYNGRKLIDGMSSWWSAIHGYNHPKLNSAAIKQIKNMSHVMFGNITHYSSIALCKKLIKMTNDSLECVFLSDSGSISIEVALKMALLYWRSLGEKRKKFVSLKNGYHGDTIGAMSVCDPKNSMNKLYSGYIKKNIFLNFENCGFYDLWDQENILPFESLFLKKRHEIAAVILEPIVQGAGGIKMYHPKYLSEVRKLCDENNILLIIDEIATGFGRTGKLFAHEYSKISPDILCVGKALTGGYITLAATITTKKIAEIISEGESKCFMHGPTFMANPLACSIANANMKIIRKKNWKKKVKNIESQLKSELLSVREYKNVSDVRILGAIGAVEMKNSFNIETLQKQFIKEGVWIRPFKNIIYIVPPFIISPLQLTKLIKSIKKIVRNLLKD
ncbi:adenosylmethionine-8-amino-7-oxononanoate aminotransferase [Candidatus Riesia sp. GBBU]|nr:adenosylmethionine-8-amino-7-oxononanoate aminotransferase [Candidatus Riesia sp. GBBU]ARC55060.1 adenosylmethionine-8-amino-7-oxononanoate aminotransferase [Candidatus Riesia sp. GBBU]